MSTLNAYVAAVQDNEEMIMGDEHKIRWGGFSDEELTDLFHGMTARESFCPPAGALADELREEIMRRRHSYRGPGIYENPQGERCEALGVINNEVVMRSPNDRSGELWIERLNEFNAENRYWTYVGPAGEGT
jgi:hypothetical protein